MRWFESISNRQLRLLSQLGQLYLFRRGNALATPSVVRFHFGKQATDTRYYRPRSIEESFCKSRVVDYFNLSIQRDVAVTGVLPRYYKKEAFCCNRRGKAYNNGR